MQEEEYKRRAEVAEAKLAEYERRVSKDSPWKHAYECLVFSSALHQLYEAAFFALLKGDTEAKSVKLAAERVHDTRYDGIIERVERLFVDIPARVTEEEFNTKLREWSTWKVWPAPFIMETWPHGVRIIPTSKDEKLPAACPHTQVISDAETSRAQCVECGEEQ